MYVNVNKCVNSSRFAKSAQIMNLLHHPSLHSLSFVYKKRGYPILIPLLRLPLICSTSSCIMDIIKSVFTSAPVHSAAIQDTFVSIMYSISYTIYNIGPLRNGSSLGALLRLRGDCRGRRGMGSSTVSILCHILGTRIVPAGYTARRSANANCVRSILLDGSL